MSRPCAYCKELGHHIKFCRLLEEKNRLKQVAPKKSSQPVSAPSTSRKPDPSLKKNMFVNLYSSSDDEVEDGEIVEDVQIHTSDSESSISSVLSMSENKWTRSGIKTVYIPKCVEVKETHDSDEESYPVYVYEPSPAWLKYQGWSWVDIEYDSDNE